MPKRTAPKPTPTEVEILGILWERGPSTVREVHQRIGTKRSIGYTGVLKLMQNMFGKGLVRRAESARAHVYQAAEPGKTKSELIRDFVQRAFGGSASRLVLHLLEDEVVSPREIEEIRQILAAHRRRFK